MNIDLGLKDKVAVVTGAGGGIGREIALALAREGVSIVVNDIGVSLTGEGGSESPAQETVGLITQLGILNPFNREQESEADYLGMIFSSLSGYDIRETVKIWERMKELNKGKEPPEFMSTHPSSDNRIKDLNEKMNDVILDYPPIEIS